MYSLCLGNIVAGNFTNEYRYSMFKTVFLDNEYFLIEKYCH
jgi:hypothetical protein